MATSSDLSRRIATLACGLLLITAQPALAASGFIKATSVTRGNSLAEVSIELACTVQYVDHLPRDSGDRLHIQLDPTSICTGVSPLIANSRELQRPLEADKAMLAEIVYDGSGAAGSTLTLVFTEAVRYEVMQRGASDVVTVRVYLQSQAIEAAATSGAAGARVEQLSVAESGFVLNLSSSRQPHDQTLPAVAEPPAGTTVYETEVQLTNATWYRLRLGPFASAPLAQVALAGLREQYPTAWIDRATEEPQAPAASGGNAAAGYQQNAALGNIGLDQIDALMTDARRAMVNREYARAAQLYTKVLQAPNHDRHREALEYLGLAREKNGQTAHAKAEYKRYIAQYPGSEGAGRIEQRLATLIAGNPVTVSSAVQPLASGSASPAARTEQWSAHAFFSQYYRRDVNQLNDEDEIVSQSALYSDVNLDVRRRGERFDFGSRLSAGYRSDFMGDDDGSGNQTRISYAYADLTDTRLGLRGRIGRQSRHNGGVLGRFDGFNLGYEAIDKLLLNAVVGKPVNSAADSIDPDRSFHGASATYGGLVDNLEVGLFYIQQQIAGVNDRQALGAEFRYFGEKKSLWGLVDYDTSYSEIGSAFLQGSWRIAPKLNVFGSLDRRYSPFLSTSNALIGQPVEQFSDLLAVMTEDEVRQLSLDRTSRAMTYTVGFSYSVSPRLQLNADGNQTSIEATRESLGVAATPASTYQYYSTSLVASSLLLEGDVSILGLRYSNSNTTKVMSLTLDTRFPIGNKFRINPRLRVDRRQILADDSYEWLYTPGLRAQFRWSRKLRVDLEAGKQFSQREMGVTDMSRESYFVNAGYQFFF